jgi:Tol biopolymer transport system component
VTWGGGRDEFPVWSPDGSRLAFSAERGENQGIHIVMRDKSGMEESILQLPDAQLSDWSRDGRFLFYSARSPKTGSDLWMLPLNGDRKPQPLDPTPGNESQAVMSPDGRMIAYTSDESGRDEIYVRSFPPPSGRWQISSGGGARPRWRGDGRELLYLSPDGDVMSVEVAAGSAPRYGAPQRLVVVPGADDFDLRGRDQLVVLMPVEHDGGRQLEVILNWAAERAR